MTRRRQEDHRSGRLRSATGAMLDPSGRSAAPAPIRRYDERLARKEIMRASVSNSPPGSRFDAHAPRERVPSNTTTRKKEKETPCFLRSNDRITAAIAFARRARLRAKGRGEIHQTKRASRRLIPGAPQTSRARLRRQASGLGGPSSIENARGAGSTLVTRRRPDTVATLSRIQCLRSHR